MLDALVEIFRYAPGSLALGMGIGLLIRAYRERKAKRASGQEEVSRE